MAEDDGTSGTTKTFTQADLDRAAAAGAQRERQRAAEKYADYDDLKKAADAAGKDKSALDRLTEQVGKLTDRAEKAELDVARREIADEFGLTPKEARRLRGNTVEALRTDAGEFVEDMGIDIDARKKGKTTTAPKGEGTEGEDEGGETAPQDDADTGRRPAPSARTRPRENLRSGAPRTETAPEETNPLKLVENIPRR
jgi:hypothetical protein